MLKNFFSWLEPFFDENGNGGYNACGRGREAVTKIQNCDARGCLGGR